MVELLAQNAQGKRFCACLRFFSRSAIGQHAWKLRHFGDPTIIVLAVCLDSKFHFFLVIHL